MQIKTFQERVKKQEEMIEQQKQEASSRVDSSMLHNELMDLEQLYVAGKTVHPLEVIFRLISSCLNTP